MAGLTTEEWWYSVGEDGRDPRLGYFASGGELNEAPPSAWTLGALECLAEPGGPEGRPFAGATHDEAAGLLASAQALEGHVAALKLAAVREIIRRHAPEASGGAFPGPSTWRLDVLHEVAAILRISVRSADPVVDLAWQLEARLPGVGELLNAGVLSWLTAKIIAEEFSVLDGDKVTEAERRLLEHDLAADDMTPGAIRRLCQRIADTVDPAGAAERREQKQRDEARVAYYREHGGAAALFATGLPPDDALRSQSNVQKRALEYKKAGVREKMDFLRVLALVDLTNGVDVPGRLALWRAEQAEKERTGDDNPGQRAWEEEQAGHAARDRYGDRPPFPDREPPDLDDRDPGVGSWNPGGPTSGNGDTGCGGPSPDAPPFPDEEPDDLYDRVEPGEPGAGTGRDRDASPEGSGTGQEDSGSGADYRPDEGDSPPGDGSPCGGDPHAGGPGRPGGPGKPDENSRSGPDGPRAGPVPAGTPDPGLPSLVTMTLPLATVLGQADRPGEVPGYGSIDPALVRKLADAAAASPRSGFCLTFTDEQGHAAAHGCARIIRGTGPPPRKTGPPGGGRDGPPGAGWEFTRDTARPGPEGGYGAWTLTLPAGTRYRVEMHAVPLHDCDHRYATGTYRPTVLLRHLVQVRDGECTFPGCSHPARDCDFEHAVPYDKGGATDACNAGMRSRGCHRVKQSPGWNVTQPEPGWHQWITPSGRSFTKGPKSYPS